MKVIGIEIMAALFVCRFKKRKRKRKREGRAALVGRRGRSIQCTAERAPNHVL
jgi:hypothetical protein